MRTESGRVAGVFSKVVHRVTAGGVEQFREILKDDAALQEFFGNPGQAVEFLSAMAESGPEAAALAARALAAPGAVRGLSLNGQAAKVMGVIEGLEPAAQASILAEPGAVNGLSDSRQAAKVMARIERLDAQAQASILAAPLAVRGLSSNGQAEALQALQQSLRQEAPPGATARQQPRRPQP